MPSWVPNWQVPGRSYYLPNEFRTRYNASTRKTPSFIIEDNRLDICGCVVDKVIWRSQTISSKSYRAGLTGSPCPTSKNVVAQIWKYLIETLALKSDISEDALFIRFCTTLNAGNRILSQQTYKDEITTDQRAADCLVVLSRLNISTSISPPKNANIPGDLNRFLATTEDLCRDRCFFVTAGGLMGLGPRVMSVRDHVCILFGAQVPFILHPLQMDERYQLCGECFLEGFMDGKAIGQLEQGELSETVFKVI